MSPIIARFSKRGRPGRSTNYFFRKAHWDFYIFQTIKTAYSSLLWFCALAFLNFFTVSEYGIDRNRKEN